MMTCDPIVEEIRRYRAEHASRYGNDLGQICEALRQRERVSTGNIIYRSPRRRLHSTDRS